MNGFITLQKEKHSKTDANTNSNAETGTDSGAGSSSLSAGESQSFTKTRVKTKISASSNAKSNSSAAARAKAFAKTNTESKVKTNLGSKNSSPGKKGTETSPSPVPYPEHKTKSTTPEEVTRPTHAYWSPSFATTISPITEITQSYNNISNSFTHAPSGESKIICVNCPVPCPYPYPCPCPCSVTPSPPTFVFCPAQCPSPPPAPSPPLQAIPIFPQPSNVLPCTIIGGPCYTQPSTCTCQEGDFFCPCKRTLGDSPSIKREKTTGISQVDIYSSHNFTYQHGAVAADHYKCSEIGKNILKKGGSAMDAAISTHLCVEVINCHSTGLGGGGFMVAYDKKKNKVFAIDFREQLPRKFNNSKKMTQGDTILIPGVLKGLELGYKKLGKLPWKDLFEEPYKLAKDGFLLHEALATALAKKKDYILANLGLREVFAPEGYILRQGHRVKRTKLAETYKKIAESGSSDIFYKGEFALDIIKDIHEAGGTMTLNDLKSYKAYIKKPLITKIKDLTLYGVKPPGSTATIAMMLKIMEKFNWNKRQLRENPGLFYHQMIEAMKFAYAPTTYLGDPKYVNNTDDIIHYMLNEKHIEDIFKKIDNKSHPVEYYGEYSNHPFSQNGGTSHISVVGPDGDAIPGKRPMSKVSPMIMLNSKKEVEIVIGAAGGFFIPTTLASTLSFYLFLHDNITTAIARPRIHCQLFPPTVVIEETFPTTIGPLLNQYSHQYVTNDTYSASGQSHAIMGVVQAIVRDQEGSYEAVCDYRKGGLPSGF
ncbi:hypothetical protein MXB_5026 [Myxobolus squamalis]|nr:hypothetical protein MXB_5026 [Myxobolus squamalis]